MSTVNKAMLKECLLESILFEVRTIENMDYSNIKSSEDFKERIKNTINTENKVKKKHYPKRIAIVLVAAVILSLSIILTVSAEIRQAVADFFVKTYETFVQLIIVENEESDSNTSGSDQPQTPITYPTTIETEYIPTYIKSNHYEQLDKIQNTQSVMHIWSNGTFIIDLIQGIIDGNDITLDTENSLFQSMYVGNKEVFFSLRNGIYTIVWLEHGYSFSLSCDEALGWEEVEKIVLSLEPVSE